MCFSLPSPVGVVYVHPATTIEAVWLVGWWERRKTGEVGAMDIFLETERLILPPFPADDVENLVALDSDPAVMRYLSGGAPTPRAVIAERMPHYLAYYERYAGYGFWAAI